MRDSEVVASIVASDAGGLAEAYDKYADPLYKYCRSMLSDPADAADAVQDTFVVVASRLADPHEPEQLRAWLYAVARNECLRILRAKSRTSAPGQAPDMTDDSADVGEGAERAELRRLLDDAAAGLNPGDREVTELHLRQGLETAEVATVLGVSRNHAHSLLSRAREQLEVCLGVLLVGRAGQGDCAELSSMLADWDGRPTVLLRKRVHRHIRGCAACSARRAAELRPATLLGLSPGAAMAAAAAQSLRVAAGPPAGLRAHTLALAAGQDAGAVAHRAAVLSRVVSSGRHGFPGPAHGPAAGTARHASAKGTPRFSPRGQAVAAGTVLAVVIAVAAFTLNDNSQHATLTGGRPPGPGPSPSAPVSVAASAVATARPGMGDGGSVPATRSQASARPTATATTAISAAPSPTAVPATAGPTTPTPPQSPGWRPPQRGRHPRRPPQPLSGPLAP